MRAVCSQQYPSIIVSVFLDSTLCNGTTLKFGLLFNFKKPVSNPLLTFASVLSLLYSKTIWDNSITAV